MPLNKCDPPPQQTFILPAHTRVTIQARVHFLDAWAGQAVYMAVSGANNRYSDALLLFDWHGCFDSLLTRYCFALPTSWCSTQHKVWSRAHRWCDKVIESASTQLPSLSILQQLLVSNSPLCCLLLRQLLPTLCSPRSEDGGTSLNVCGNPRFPDTLSVPLEVLGLWEGCGTEW